MNYERRDNTAWWKVEIEKRIDKGRELEELNSFPDFKDIENYRQQICDWQGETALHLTRIYKDASVAQAYCPPIAMIDLENISRKEAKTHLKKIIAERVDSLRNLIANTK